jgi:hypothetical protein
MPLKKPLTLNDFIGISLADLVFPKNAAHCEWNATPGSRFAYGPGIDFQPQT